VNKRNSNTVSVAYFIGRFQPFHLGHLKVVTQALSENDFLIIGVGQTGCAPTSKNPWTFKEVSQFITESLPDLEHRVEIIPIYDNPYHDDLWAKDAKKALQGGAEKLVFIPSGASTEVPKVDSYLVGHRKDSSSFYLDLFPEWILEEYENYEDISATDIRESFLSISQPPAPWTKRVPDEVMKLMDSMPIRRYCNLAEEAIAIQENTSEWESEGAITYGAQHVTVDALAYDDENDSILLITRKGNVGKDAYALPGGYVNASERLLDAAFRELGEETGLPASLLASLKKNADPFGLVAFDHPSRSAFSGRIVTHVAWIWIPNGSKLYPPAAGDDASTTQWVSFADLPSLKSKFFSDHYFIIEEMKNRYWA